MSEGTGQLPNHGAPPAAYRCFLFADLRGYTAYIERAGNAAGADLVREYLALTRTAVERFHGAEIKVEGDGFHAVFPSASAAVMCGLAIVEAAGEATEKGRPINVGVGIHAGEAVETPDGFIGSAVNMAARVCSAASSNEVLVTSTVRGVTQASIDVTFSPRGRQKLKGMNEPVELYAVTSGGMGTARRRSNQRWLAAIGLGAVALLAVAVVAFAVPGLTPRPTPTPVPTAAPLAIGPLELGQHVADQFNPPFTFNIEDSGWAVYRVYPDGLGLQFGEPVEGKLDVANIPLVYADPCGGGSTESTGTSVDGLIEAFQRVEASSEQPWLHVGEVTAAEIGGNFAKTVEITIDQGAQIACSGFSADGIAIFPLAEDEYRAMAGETFRLQATDVDATTISFLTSAVLGPAQSVPMWQQMLERADRVIQSVEF